MAWGFRRSFSLGKGVRLNFSRSGVSTSLGVKGFRMNFGPRGTFVTLGAGGFYYRTRLGSTSRDPSHSRQFSRTPAPSQDLAHPDPVQGFLQIDSDELVQTRRSSGTELLDTLNALGRPTWILWAYIVLSALGIGSTVLLRPQPALWVAVGLILLIGLLFALFADAKKRRFVLAYDLGAESGRKYDRLVYAYNNLKRAGSKRGLNQENRHGDWKRHGGATRTETFYRLRVAGQRIPRVLTNLEHSIAIAGQNRQLFFLPDQVLVKRGSRYSSVSYSELHVATKDGIFVWDESVPHDAEVVGYSWLYTRRDGGPDRRFSNNRQIPNVRVYYLVIESATGLRMQIQCTSRNAVSAMALAIRELAGTPEAPNSRASDPAIAEALSVFGLSTMPSATTLRNLYKDLTKRNHPDRFAQMGQDVQLMAVHRMQEINAAYQSLATVAGAAASELVLDTNNTQFSIRYVSANARIALAGITSLILAAAGSVVVYANSEAINRYFSAAPTPDALSALRIANTIPEPTHSDRTIETKRTPDAATAQPQLLEIAHDCNVRSKPENGAKVIAGVQKGAILQVLDDRGAWKLAQVREKRGWIAQVCWKP